NVTYKQAFCLTLLKQHLCIYQGIFKRQTTTDMGYIVSTIAKDQSQMSCHGIRGTLSKVCWCEGTLVIVYYLIQQANTSFESFFRGAYNNSVNLSISFKKLDPTGNTHPKGLAHPSQLRCRNKTFIGWLGSIILITLNNPERIRITFPGILRRYGYGIKYIHIRAF